MLSTAANHFTSGLKSMANWRKMKNLTSGLPIISLNFFWIADVWRLGKSQKLNGPWLSNEFECGSGKKGTEKVLFKSQWAAKLQRLKIMVYVQAPTSGKSKRNFLKRFTKEFEGTKRKLWKISKFDRSFWKI